jgi:hypothetical protein
MTDNKLMQLFISSAIVVVSACNNQDKQVAAKADSLDVPKDTTLNIRTLTGELEIKPVVNNQPEASEYWIYIDQTLVHKSGDEKNDLYGLRLVPGEYTAEIAVRKYPESTGQVCFPFEFISKKIVITAGEKTSISLPAENSYGAGEIRPDYSTTSPDEYWYNNLSGKLFELDTTWYKKPAAVALNDVNIALSVSPPLSDKVFINLPKEYGAGRQFDAVQVRLLIDWLKHDLWDWFPAAPYEMPDYIRQKYDYLENLVGREKAAIDRLNEIAIKLEKTKG